MKSCILSIITSSVLFDIHGEKRSQQQGRAALAILIGCAHAKCTITYSALAQQIGTHPRALTLPLHTIAATLAELREAWSEEIPHVQWLAVSKASGVPSNGIGLLTDNGVPYATLPLKRKRVVMRAEWDKIFRYSKWERVLACTRTQ